MTVFENGVTTGPIDDSAAAAIELATILHRHRELTLVAHPTGNSALRGNERDTADIYPPSRRPQISIEGQR